MGAPASHGTAIVTRPAGQADALVRAIESAGFDALHVPAMRIVALEASDDVRGVWRSLREFDFIHFASANAIDVFFAHAARFGPPGFAPTAAIGVMGPGSCAAFERHASHPRLIVPGQERREVEPALDSESMLATLAVLHPQPFARALFVKGEGGRDLLANALRRAGTEVVELPVYSRARAAPTPAQCQALKHAVERGWCCTMFTSSEGAGYFSESIDDLNLGELRARPAIATHPRIVQAAQALGWRHVELCAPGDDALVHKLKSITQLR